jgi:hypothetical protein
MNQLISKIENSMPYMVLGFYAEYLNAWVRSFESTSSYNASKRSPKNQVRILHSVKA